MRRRSARRVSLATQAAVCVLCLVLAAVAVNAYAVRRLSDELSARVGELPLSPAGVERGELLDVLNGIADELDANEAWLNLSVSYRLLNETQVLLDQLKVYAAAGDAVMYGAALAALKSAVEDISRMERLTPDTLF